MALNLGKLLLKCEICNQFHNYECNQHSLIALSAEWIQKDSRFGLLAQPPYYDDLHQIRIQGRLKLNLEIPFWVLWMAPVSQVDGLETEQGIKQLSFYLCEPVDIVKIQNTEAIIRVKVLDFKNLSDANHYKKPDLKWHTMLDTEASSRHHYRIKNFKTFSLINISIEGDLGMLAIIHKQNQKSRIVALHEWDFHLDIWYCYSEPLSQDQETKYGIKYLTE